MFHLQAVQNNMLSYEKIYPGTSTYHYPVAIQLNGKINIPLLEKAFNFVINRHDILRSCIKEDNQGAYFNIIPNEQLQKKISWPVQHLDASTVPHAPIDALYDTLKKLHAEKVIDDPFVFSQEPLWRAAIIKFSETDYQIVFLFHHLIVDGKSVNIILNDLTQAYNALLNNQSLPLLVSIPPITDINTNLPPEEIDKRLSYWQTTLKELNSLDLQTDFSSKQPFRFSGKRLSFNLDADLVKQLEKTFTGYSINQILIASFYALLYRYSGETDICLGITSANRRHPHISSAIADNLVNSFFNSIPLRLTFTTQSTLADILSSVKTVIKESLENQLPLDMVIQKALSSEVKSNLGTASPFKIMFVLNRKRTTLDLQGIKASASIELDLGHAKFPYFGINLDELNDGSYQGFFEINGDLFKDATIKRFIAHWKTCLEYIVKQPDCKMLNIPFLLDEEKLLIETLNQTDNAPAFQGLVHDYFHQQAVKQPDQSAIVFHEKIGEKIVKISYSELDQLSTQLANYMQQSVPKHMPSQPYNKPVIGVCLSRSPALMTGIIAAFKTGCPLLTLENNDSEVLRYKLKQHIFSHIIVDEQTKLLFKDMPDLRTLNIEDPSVLNLVHQEKSIYHPPACTPDDLVYIMYTSGTTGTPKAVMITHAGFSNLLNALIHQQFKPNSRILALALPTFDAFFYDWLVALATTGELHLCGEEDRNPTTINNIIRQANINFAVFLPDFLSKLDPMLPLEYITSMGAMARETIMQEWLQAKPDRQIFNGYGPTETTIGICIRPYKAGDNVAFIGGLFDNMKIYILNPDNLSICPPGVIGEIYIAGPGVAKGYWNNPDLNKQKFPCVIFHPDTFTFSKVKESEPQPVDAIKLYASGDYACYQITDDHQLDIKLIGRKDRQLKIRGVRVELEGIEANLRQHPLIQDVTIVQNKNIKDIAKDEDQEALTAYVVSSSSDITDESKMINTIYKYLLSTSLSLAAYPTSVVLLLTIPTTKNGKVDVSALPVPTSALLKKPRTPYQHQLQEIWSDLLNCPKERIGINTPFRALGGDSLALLRLKFQLNQKFKLTEPIGSNNLWPMVTIAQLEKSLLPKVQQRTLVKIPTYSQNPNVLHHHTNNSTLTRQVANPNQAHVTNKKKAI